MPDCIHYNGACEVAIGDGEYRLTVPAVDCARRPGPVPRTMCAHCCHYERQACVKVSIDARK